MIFLVRPNPPRREELKISNSLKLFGTEFDSHTHIHTRTKKNIHKTQKRTKINTPNAHFTTVLSQWFALVQFSPVKNVHVPQFWASATHEVTRGAATQKNCILPQIWASDTHEVTKGHRRAQEFAFYHSFFERPTRTKWREGRAAAWKKCILPQVWASDAHEVTKGSLGEGDSHHFSRTLAVFDDALWRQPSLQQSLMTVLFSKEPFAAAFGKNKKTFIILLTQRESISFILGYHCSIGPLTRPDESKEFKDRQWLGRRIDWGHIKGRRSHQTINSIYHLWIQVCIIAIYCRMAVCRISSMWFTALCWFGIFYILHRM